MDVPGWLRSFYNCSALLPRAVKVEGMVDEVTRTTRICMGRHYGEAVFFLVRGGEHQ